MLAVSFRQEAHRPGEGNGPTTGIGLLRGDARLDEAVARVFAESSFAVLEAIGKSEGVSRSAILATYTTALLIEGVVTPAELAKAETAGSRYENSQSQRRIIQLRPSLGSLR